MPKELKRPKIPLPPHRAPSAEQPANAVTSDELSQLPSEYTDPLGNAVRGGAVSAHDPIATEIEYDMSEREVLAANASRRGRPIF